MNVLKYPLLTFFLVIEFFIICSISITPIEHSFIAWLVTVLLFELYDQLTEQYKEESKC